MAKEIKSFVGGGSGALYTVPAGRYAKVNFNYLLAGANIYISGLLAYSNTTSFGGTIMAGSVSTSTVSPGANQSIGLSSGNQVIVTTVWYMGAGQSITSDAGAPYSFLVIEEY